MKIFILTFILLTSSTYANTCTDYFHPFRVTRLEDLSEDEYEILETIARFELEARATLDAHLRNSRLADLNTHFEYLAQLEIDPAVYHEIRESFSRNESSKAKIRNERIQKLKDAFELERTRELTAQRIINSIINGIERQTSLRGDSLQSLFDQAIAARPHSDERIVTLEWMETILKSSSKYFLSKVSTESKNKALEQAILEDSHEFVKVFLDFGANPNAITTNGMTMLHYAVLQKNTDIIRTLIEYKADTNAVFQSNSILHTAIENGDHRNFQLLLQHGANVHATNKDGETPLHFAAAKSNWWIIDSLLEHGANVHATNKDGETPLHLAAKIGNFMNTRSLLQNKANVHAITKDGQTAFHFAAESGKSNMILELINYNANPHAKNNQGETPLYRAVLKKNEEAVRYLVDISDKHAVSHKGESLLQIANSEDYKNKTIHDLLKDGHAGLKRKQLLKSALNQIKKLGTTFRKIKTPSNQKKP